MALFDFNSVPGLGTSQETAERTFLWGKHEQVLFRSIVLLSTSTDNGNSPNTTIRTGMILSQYNVGTNSNEWVPYKSNATDGSQIAAGILAFDVKMTNTQNVVGNRVAVAVVGGPIKANQLLRNAPVQASTTLTGIDPQARAQLGYFCKFDDQLNPNSNPWQNVVTKGSAGVAGTYSVLASDSGTEFTTTTGDTTSTTFTLPALLDANSNPVCKGCIFRFYNTVDLNMVIAASGSDKIVVLNDDSHSTATFSTSSQKKGALLEIRTDDTGTKWLGTVLNGATVTMS